MWIMLALRDVGPWTFTAVRYVGAAVVIGAALALYRGPGHVMPVRGERTRLAVIGLLQRALLTILLTLSILTNPLAMAWNAVTIPAVVSALAATIP